MVSCWRTRALSIGEGPTAILLRMGASMRAFLFALFLLGGCLPAASQQVMKGEVKVTPMSSGGVPVGCSLEYILVISDRVYRSGGVVGLTGTFAWLAGKDRMGIAGMFKLGAADFDQNMRKSAFKPASTVLSIGGKVHRPQEPMPCEDNNFVCGAYSTEGSLGVLSAMLNGPIEVGYNRRLGSFDVMVPLDVSNDEMMRLTGCMQNFMRSLKTK
jgi:hypothetical protein